MNTFKKVRSFIANTTNGMAIGLFGTLIIGTILNLISKIPYCDYVSTFAKYVQSLMGFGIGLGVAIALKEKGIRMVTIAVCGACGTQIFSFIDGGVWQTFSDPLSCYCASLVGYFAIKLIMRRQTPVDILLIPLVGLICTMFYSFFVADYVHYITVGIGEVIEASFDVVPLLMCIIVSVLVGMALTAPISSVAICVAIAIGNTPLAAGAALVGCCTQMVGFAVHTARDNKVGSVIAVGIGTSMLQFKNIVKKPLIWLPTIIASAILGVFAYVFKFKTDSVGAGMGTSGLVGILDTFDVMGYKPLAIIEVLGICVVAPIALVFGLDLLFRKIGWIQKGDFALATSDDFASATPEGKAEASATENNNNAEVEDVNDEALAKEDLKEEAKQELNEDIALEDNKEENE
ncbi:MAG: PTS sugar transporter subunit IIC [Acholeplasmatales bacterium]|nr:PTS sugar transporter subunit IIC [Acholeplasmatales bacterium]